MSFQVTFYNAAKHNTYKAAKDAHEAYTTGSTLDMFQNRSVFEDTLDVIETMARCVGIKSIAAGIVAQNGRFISLDTVAELWTNQGGGEFRLAQNGATINSLLLHEQIALFAMNNPEPFERFEGGQLEWCAFLIYHAGEFCRIHKDTDWADTDWYETSDKYINHFLKGSNL